MRKSLILLVLAIFVSIPAVNAASELRPLNVQNAHIDVDSDRHNEVRINFDWFRDHFGRSGVHNRTSTYNLPRVDWRHAFDTSIPTRIGLNLGLSAGATEMEAGGTEFFERSAFGFSNLGLTLEAGVVQGDNTAITLYINQHFPWIHNGLLAANTLRPVNGVNAYGFQTGAEYQFSLADSLTWYGDIGYRFDVPRNGSTQHSLVYYNELVMAFDDSFGISLGLLGNSVYTNDIGTDLRIVPGVITKVGDNSQVRVGIPIGINPDSPDFGIQASLFTQI